MTDDEQKDVQAEEAYEDSLTDDEGEAVGDASATMGMDGEADGSTLPMRLPPAMNSPPTSASSARTMMPRSPNELRGVSPPTLSIGSRSSIVMPVGAVPRQARAAIGAPTKRTASVEIAMLTATAASTAA